MIVLENITKKFAGITALEKISLNFAPKEATVIIGPSGSGKSTLLRCIKQLDNIDDGHILIDGTKVTARNRSKLCSKLGMVFQQFHLFNHMNVLENLLYAPVNVLKLSPAEMETKAINLLQKFGVADKIHSMIKNLSGGQKQRIAICRALMMDPEMLLFDEPTSALDPEIIQDIVAIINALKEYMGMIIVTHDIRFAKSVADRVIFLDHGKILCDQPRDLFFSKPESERAKQFLLNVGELEAI